MMSIMVHLNAYGGHRPKVLSEPQRGFKYCYVAALKSLLFVTLVGPLFNTLPASANTETPKTVLVLYTTGVITPGYFIFDRQLRATFKASSNERVTLYTEYLDTLHVREESY